ncbi:MAG: ATP-binding protein [Sphingomonadaceae bacterium]
MVDKGALSSDKRVMASSTLTPNMEDTVPVATDAPGGEANMRQLIALRWLAVGGQFGTIMVVFFGMGVELPLAPMMATIAGLVALNLVSIASLRRGTKVGNREIFLALILDNAALTALLYLSGGATNPFIWLFLLQVVLGAVLLDRWSVWVVTALSAACFVVLLLTHYPLVLPPKFAVGLFDLYIFGALTSFLLIAVLLVFFVTRINDNVRASDASLAQLRQQAAEEDHIVRMGLLATGAAHELGTPLASLSVIANDWSHRPELAAFPDLAEEIEDVRIAVERCKAIVTGILTSAGEVRGEKPEVTRLAAFLDEIAQEWRQRSGEQSLRCDIDIGEDIAIVSDIALQQVIWNVLDNAFEASGKPVELTARRIDGELLLSVTDDGPGFDDGILRNIGKPYRSTKQRQGAGLGLFLVINVMRKMGGSLVAANRPAGGAEVVLALPIEAIAWNGRTQA